MTCMSAWDEARHVRDGAGKFAETAGSAPEPGGLADDRYTAGPYTIRTGGMPGFPAWPDGVPMPSRTDFDYDEMGRVAVTFTIDGHTVGAAGGDNDTLVDHHDGDDLLLWTAGQADAVRANLAAARMRAQSAVDQIHGQAAGSDEVRGAINALLDPHAPVGRKERVGQFTVDTTGLAPYPGWPAGVSEPEDARWDYDEKGRVFVQCEVDGRTLQSWEGDHGVTTTFDHAADDVREMAGTEDRAHAIHVVLLHMHERALYTVSQVEYHATHDPYAHAGIRGLIERRLRPREGGR